MGLPGHDSIQEFNHSYDGESGRGEDNQATLARSGNPQERRATPVRDPAGTLGSSGERRHARSQVDDAYIRCAVSGELAIPAEIEPILRDKSAGAGSTFRRKGRGQSTRELTGLNFVPKS